MYCKAEGAQFGAVAARLCVAAHTVYLRLRVFFSFLGTPDRGQLQGQIQHLASEKAEHTLDGFSPYLAQYLSSTTHLIGVITCEVSRGQQDPIFGGHRVVE